MIVSCHLFNMPETLAEIEIENEDSFDKENSEHGSFINRFISENYHDHQVGDTYYIQVSCKDAENPLNHETVWKCECTSNGNPLGLTVCAIAREEALGALGYDSP